MESQHLHHLRHSLAHVLAAAVKELLPKTIFGIGPVIENGFYYDFLLPRPLTEQDLPKIQKIMKRIIAQGHAFERMELSPTDAKKLFTEQPFKRELIADLLSHGTTVFDEIQDNKAPASHPSTQITAYKTGSFIDLCRGGHVENTRSIPQDAFALTHIAGAYWRGDEKNQMLQRVYGVAFETKKELDAYLALREEAKKRDHRIIGKEMGLFTFSDLVGAGLPLYTPRGAMIRRKLNEYVESLQSAQEYHQVWTPQIAKAKLFQTSGHYDKYKDGMFRVISQYGDEEFYLKPMNCPQHTQIFSSQPHSYRELPIRYTDFAMLYRDEKPGELSGLARVRAFSQDDCHVFCREDQVDDEIDVMLAMTKKVMKTFGFSYYYRLSTRDPKQPKKFLGDPAMWNKVEAWAVRIMKRNKIAFKDGPGEAAFYAPKMDLMATDALGREWQLSTIQIDYVLPERFGLEYTDKDGNKKRPVMLHRAIIGSPERFLMILIEHFAGAFPLWLAPVQVSIIPVGKKHVSFSKKLKKELSAYGIRVWLSEANETVGYKIRESSKMKVPYMLVIGDKEMKSTKLQIRVRGTQKLKAVSKKSFIADLQKKILARSLSL